MLTDRALAGLPARNLPNLVPVYQLKVTTVTVAAAVISMTWGDATFNDVIVRWIMVAAAAGLGVAFFADRIRPVARLLRWVALFFAFLSTFAALAVVILNVASLWY